ncbi:MAG: GAF domain-containing sensor histidine kinase [Candidatus Methylomirabilales bacterium]
MKVKRKRKEEMVTALYRAGLAIQEPLEFQDRLDRLLQTARTVLELDRVNILLADADAQWLQAVASTGTTDPLEAIRVPIGPAGGGVAQAYLTRQPVVWDGRADLPEALRLQPPYDRITALRSRVFANLPLVVQGRAIGVLGADRKRSRRALEPATLELLQLFAAQAALAIEHARLYEEEHVAALHLEELVESRTQELQDANAKLQEALRRSEESSHTKSRFLATMSHELRTPLNAIIGFAELLQDQQFGLLNEKQQRYVGHVLSGGQHLLSLINGILDLAKVEAGKLELHPQPFPLPEAIRAALDSLRPQAEAKRLEFHLTLEGCPATLVADPVRFRQILYNLFSNALKFTPEGGHVTVIPRLVLGSPSTMHSGDIPGCEASSVNREPHPGAVEIAVQDSGVGIKTKDLAKLFEPFTQLDASLSRHHEGTGLGLALTKKLVELHGGSIGVQSLGEGRGCTFTVTLPLQCPVVAPATTEPSPEGTRAKAFTS